MRSNAEPIYDKPKYRAQIQSAVGGAPGGMYAGHVYMLAVRAVWGHTGSGCGAVCSGDVRGLELWRHAAGVCAGLRNDVENGQRLASICVSERLAGFVCGGQC